MQLLIQISQQQVAIKPSLYGGRQICPAKQFFFATVQKRLVLDC